MKRRIRWIGIGWSVALGGLLLGADLVARADRRGDDAAADKKDPKPDNTRVNQRDRQAGEPTADQQKNNSSDLETTRKIRRALVTDKSLSMYAHNVKIIAQNGTVTLKGPVRSEEEKKIVETKAAEVAGAVNVKSEIEIAAAKK